MISDLTYKMVAYTVVEDFNPDECIDWAVEMLEVGIDTPILRIIASMDKPVNYFETVEYLEKAFQELGISKKTEEKGLFSYCTFLIIKITKKDKTKKNLRNLRDVILRNDLIERFMDFCLLSWAWGELSYDEKEVNQYWPGATQDNIEEIVTSTAQKWLEENKPNYEIKSLLS